MSNFLEKTLEDIIYENRDIIQNRGFPKLLRHTKRQLKLPSGFIIDLFSFQIDTNVLHFKIIELKRDTITMDSIAQIGRYYDEISWLTSAYPFVNYDLILVGKEIDNAALAAWRISQRLFLYTYKYDYNGIKFDQRTESLFDKFPSEGYTNIIDNFNINVLLNTEYDDLPLK